MTPTARTPERNRLLLGLPADQYVRLAADFEVVRLNVRQVLSVPDQTIQYVYFPRDAVITLLVPMENGTCIEGATVGNEGMIGLHVALGAATATEEVVVQIAGDAVQMGQADFRQALEYNPLLNRVVSRYTPGADDSVRANGRVQPLALRSPTLCTVADDEPRPGGP
jgi:hypothetical protein